MTKKESLQKIITAVEMRKGIKQQSTKTTDELQREIAKTLAPLFNELARQMVGSLSVQFGQIIRLIEKKNWTDMAETNRLLREMKDKLNEPCDITLTLK